MEEGKEVKKRGARRKNGEGSKPYYDKKRKRWRIQYTDNEGKPQVVYDKTEQGVIAKFQEIKVALNKGKYVKKSQDTIAEIMDYMLKKQKKKKKRRMKANSFNRKLNTRNMLLNYMGDLCNKPISKVTIEQIEDAFTKLEELKKPNGDYKYAQSTLGKRLFTS